jgi:hypothetical protein
MEDTDALDLLEGLHAQLDELNEFRLEDMAEEMDYDTDSEENEVKGNDSFEDPTALAAAENEDKVTADEMFDLAIRSTSDSTSETPTFSTIPPIQGSASEKTDYTNEAPTPTFSFAPPTKGSTPSDSKSGKLRRQKSTRFSKGGAFHAQQFTKSIGKEASRSTASRTSVLGMDWTSTTKDEDE